MHRITKEDRDIIRKVLDVKEYDPEDFDPELLNEMEDNYGIFGNKKDDKMKRLWKTL